MTASSAWTLKTDWHTGRQVSAPAAAPRRTWSEPPRPGIISKRPLGFFETLDAGFRVLRANPASTFGFAAILLSLGTVAALAAGSLVVWLNSRFFASLASSSADAANGFILVAEVATMVVSFVLLPAAQLFSGLSTHVARRAYDGKRVSLKTMWSLSRGVRFRLIAAAVLLTAGHLLIAVLCFAPAVLAALFGTELLSIVLFLLGTLVFLIATVLYVHKTAFTGSAITFERLPLWAAIRRSWVLTGRNVWRVLGELLAAYFISTQLVQILAGPVMMALWVLLGIGLLVTGGGGFDLVLGLILLLAVLLSIAAGIAGTALLVAYWGTFLAVVYLDQRVRTEGYDLVMLREAEDLRPTEAAA